MMQGQGQGQGQEGLRSSPFRGCYRFEDQAQSRIGVANSCRTSDGRRPDQDGWDRPGARASYRRLNQLGGGDHFA